MYIYIYIYVFIYKYSIYIIYIYIYIVCVWDVHNRLTNTFLPHFAQDSPIHKLKMNKLRKKGHQSESGWVSPYPTGACLLVLQSSVLLHPWRCQILAWPGWLHFFLDAGEQLWKQMMISFCRISSRGPPSQVPIFGRGRSSFFSKNLLLPGHVHKPSPFIPLEKPSGGKILNNIIEGTKMISSHFWGPMEKKSSSNPL